MFNRKMKRKTWKVQHTNTIDGEDYHHHCCCLTEIHVSVTMTLYPDYDVDNKHHELTDRIGCART